MKHLQIIFLLLNLFLSSLLVSCNDDDEYEKIGVAVETFEATANFDLSARANWTLYFGGKKYDYVINGKKLTATSPKEKPFRFEYGTENGQAQFHLRPGNYDKTKSESFIPVIEDQSTLEKFIACDPLRANYSGKVAEDLSGIKIYHYNALLTFNVENLPEGAKVYIIMKDLYHQTITPLQDTNDRKAYKAIVLPENPIDNIYVSIITNSKVYEGRLYKPETKANMPYPKGIGSSAIVSFTVYINAEDKLIIDDLKRESYSQEWPISQ